MLTEGNALFLTEFSPFSDFAVGGLPQYSANGVLLRDGQVVQTLARGYNPPPVR
jgi:hypothetical protein